MIDKKDHEYQIITTYYIADIDFLFQQIQIQILSKFSFHMR